MSGFLCFLYARPILFPRNFAHPVNLHDDSTGNQLNGLTPRSEELEASDGGKKRKIGKRKKRRSERKEIETSKERAVVDNAGSYTKY